MPQATAIFDATHKGLSSFDRIAAKYDESILVLPFIPDDSLSSKSRDSSSRDFLGLRNSFLSWIDYIGALSSMDSSLDRRLQRQKDISFMVIELLEMIVRNLQRREY